MQLYHRVITTPTPSVPSISQSPGQRSLPHHVCLVSTRDTSTDRTCSRRQTSVRYKIKLGPHALPLRTPGCQRGCAHTLEIVYNV